MPLRNKEEILFHVNDLVYVDGDYFDEDVTNRWSEKIAKINYKKQSLIGLVKSFTNKYNLQYVNVLWFADFKEHAVLLKDVRKIPSNLKPITGVINNFNIYLADYVKINKKNNKNNKIKMYNKMTKDEVRLSGEKVVVIDNYESQNVSEIYNLIH